MYIYISVEVVDHELSEKEGDTVFGMELYSYKGRSAELRDNFTVVIDGNKVVKFNDKVSSIHIENDPIGDFIEDS